MAPKYLFSQLGYSSYFHLYGSGSVFEIRIQFSSGSTTLSTGVPGHRSSLDRGINTLHNSY